MFHSYKRLTRCLAKQQLLLLRWWKQRYGAGDIRYLVLCWATSVKVLPVCTVLSLLYRRRTGNSGRTFPISNFTNRSTREKIPFDDHDDLQPIGLCLTSAPTQNSNLNDCMQRYFSLLSSCHHTSDSLFTPLQYITLHTDTSGLARQTNSRME